KKTMMLVSLAFVIWSTLLILPTITTSIATPSHRTLNPLRGPYATICYDRRYANRRPSIVDCVAIIQHQIPWPTRNLRIIRTFARHPRSQELAVPYTWTTPMHECNVTIDIPELPGRSQVARASMLDIKDAALSVLTKCVRDGDHLGEFAATGTANNLLVRVEAGDESVVGAVEATATE
ncbi:MAG: hypothetical protein Q9210_007347, partial [Variospora velana]